MTRFSAFLLCVLLTLPAQAAQITSLRVGVGDDADHVSVRLSERAKYKLFRVDTPPPRVVLDIENTKTRSHVSLPDNYKGTLIRSVRFGFHDQTTGRLVFDLSSDVRPRNVQLIGSLATGGYWLEFDLPHPASPAPAVQGSTQETPAKHKHVAQFRPKHTSRPVIVIDAGHGGQDPGTSGESGTQEKSLTLRYAQALEQSLTKSGRYRVFLTRTDDRYLLLRERVRRARGAYGDLFISLHADSAPTRFARGLSVYTISEKSSDKESEALAAQENRADVIGGMDLSDESDDVAGILIDLTERETRAKSAEFADMAVKYLGREVGLLSNTHRFAGFAVLKAPDIPSVLVEIGFLTNPKEESQLKSRAYEGKVVRGLTQAVDDYFGKKK